MSWGRRRRRRRRQTEIRTRSLWVPSFFLPQIRSTAIQMFLREDEYGQHFLELRENYGLKYHFGKSGGQRWTWFIVAGGRLWSVVEGVEVTMSWRCNTDVFSPPQGLRPRGAVPMVCDLGGCEHGWGRGRTHVQVAVGAGQGSGTVPDFHGIGLHEEVRAQNSVMSRRLIKLKLKLGKIVQSNDISRLNSMSY